ncbi:hypothetical protein GCM10027060_11850 [Nesterenkonia halophila]
MGKSGIGVPAPTKISTRETEAAKKPTSRRRGDGGAGETGVSERLEAGRDDVCVVPPAAEASVRFTGGGTGAGGSAPRRGDAGGVQRAVGVEHSLGEVPR